MLKDYVELLVSKVLLESNDLLVQLVYKANVDQKGTMVLKVLSENKVIVVDEVNVVNEEKRAFKVMFRCSKLIGQSSTNSTGDSIW